jgi:hypothetical protein
MGAKDAQPIQPDAAQRVVAPLGRVLVDVDVDATPPRRRPLGHATDTVTLYC